VRHPARKRSGSILTTPEPARGGKRDEWKDSITNEMKKIQSKLNEDELEKEEQEKMRNSVITFGLHESGSAEAEVRGHLWKLKVNRCRLQVRRCFFSQRIISTWNKLPASVVEVSCVNSFKKRLDDWRKDVELSTTLTSNTSTSYKLQATLP